MTSSDWIALGALLLAAVGSAAGVWAHLNAKISGNTKDLHTKIDERVGEVHEKIDAVKRDYVRRDDLKDDLHNLQQDIGRIERGQENVAAKVDSFGTSLLPAIADLARAAITLGRS